MSARQADPSVRASSFALLLLSVAVLVYGSIYPWRFVTPPHSAWDHFWDVSIHNDFVLNVLIYVPIGFLALAATGNIAIACVIGFALSGGVELVQPYFDRTSSVIDLAANTIGSFGGALIAHYALLKRRRVWLPSRPLFLLSLWAFHQLYPFHRIGRGMAMHWFRAAPIAATDLVEFSANWAAAAVLAVLAWPNRPRAAILLVALLLPLRPVLCARPISPAEATAWALLTTCGLLVGGRLRSFATLAGIGVAAALLFAELAPYRFSVLPSRFHWLPFEALLAYDWSFAVIVATRKAFVYGAIIFLLGRADLMRAAASAAFAIFILEWTQRWLPGRTPDITDPLLTLLLAVILLLLRAAGQASKCRA